MSKKAKIEHVPVLLQEIIEGLKVKPGRKYIDATLGEAGHAKEIISRGGIVLAIDLDKKAVARSIDKLRKIEEARIESQFFCVVGNFKDIKTIAKEQGFEPVSGVLFDLGVSSIQLGSREKGLSFGLDAALDMRLDPDLKKSARDLVNNLSQERLYEIFTRNAQEELARPISKAIVRARRLKPIRTTGQLAEIVSGVTKRKRSRIHPATRTFLALRMEVNNEIENLRLGVSGALDILESGGRLLVISFHETEDRIVKQLFSKAGSKGRIKIETKKPITPGAEEIKKNLRSRSAKLRIAEKL